jgi:hypothetical protein
MRARRRQRDLVAQSSNVTSARSDLAPKAFLSSSDDLPITASRSSDLPLSQISNLPDVELARKVSKIQAVKRIPKSMPQPSPSRLVPGLPDQAFIQSDEAFLDEDDLPCAPGKARKGRRPNDYHISSRLRDTVHRALTVSSLETLVSTYDSGSSPLSLTSVLVISSFGRTAREGQDHDFESFVFFIPPDCPTSKPVASRSGLLGSARRAVVGAAASAGVDPLTRVIEATRH